MWQVFESVLVTSTWAVRLPMPPSQAVIRAASFDGLQSGMAATAVAVGAGDAVGSGAVVAPGAVGRGSVLGEAAVELVGDAVALPASVAPGPPEAGADGPLAAEQPAITTDRAKAAAKVRCIGARRLVMGGRRAVPSKCNGTAQDAIGMNPGRVGRRSARRRLRPPRRAPR